MEVKNEVNVPEAEQPEQGKKGKYSLWIRLTALLLVVAILMNLTSVDFSLLRYQGTDQMAAAQYLMDSTPYLGNSRLQRLKSLLTDLDPYSIHLQAAEIAIAKTDYEGAAEFLNKCISHSQDDLQKAELYSRMGCVYMLSENTDQAQLAFNSSIALDPDEPIPYLLRAQLRYQSGDTAGAAEDSAAYLSLGGSDSEMLPTAASISELSGDLENAEEAVSRQLKAASDDNGKALAYAERGRIRYLMGREAEARKDIEQAKQLDSNVLTGVHYAIVGLAEYNAGDYENGGKDFLRAARLSEEGNAEYYEQAIMCGYLSGNYEFIAEAIEEARKKSQMTANSLLIEGILMFSEGRYEEADASFSDAIEIGQIVVGTYYYRGLSRLAMNQYETAAEDFTEAMNWEEDTMNCLFNRGICYFATGENEKAKADLQAVFESSKDEALALSAQELLQTMEDLGQEE